MPGCIPRSAATSAAERTSTATPQNACHVRFVELADESFPGRRSDVVGDRIIGNVVQDVDRLDGRVGIENLAGSHQRVGAAPAAGRFVVAATKIVAGLVARDREPASRETCRWGDPCESRRDSGRPRKKSHRAAVLPAQNGYSTPATLSPRSRLQFEQLSSPAKNSIRHRSFVVFARDAIIRISTSLIASSISVDPMSKLFSSGSIFDSWSNRISVNATKRFHRGDVVHAYADMAKTRRTASEARTYSTHCELSRGSSRRQFVVQAILVDGQVAQHRRNLTRFKFSRLFFLRKAVVPFPESPTENALTAARFSTEE